MKFKVGDYITRTYPDTIHRVWKIYDIHYGHNIYRLVCILHKGKNIQHEGFIWSFNIDHVDSAYDKIDESVVLAKVL